MVPFWAAKPSKNWLIEDAGSYYHTPWFRHPLHPATLVMCTGKQLKMGKTSYFQSLAWKEKEWKIALEVAGIKYIYGTIKHYMANDCKIPANDKTGYTFKGESFKLGLRNAGRQCAASGADVLVPVQTMNQHGLVAGAPAEQVKQRPTAGIGRMPGDASIYRYWWWISRVISVVLPLQGINGITERCQKLGIEFKPAGYPVELLTLSNPERNSPRATVSGVRPCVLIQRSSGWNDTQGGLCHDL